MDPATGPDSDEADRDPDFHAAEVGPIEHPDPPTGAAERRRRQFALRTLMGVIALIAVWMGVLLDPNVAPLVWVLLGAFGIGLSVLVAAMGLGLLGFGLFAAGGWVIAWLRRAARWPED
jgi:hypothetical protein